MKTKGISTLLFVALLCLSWASSDAAARQGGRTAGRRKAAPAQSKGAAKKAGAKGEAGAAADGDASKAELDALLQLPPSERVPRLQEFLSAQPEESPQRARAAELLTSARAALGDERLRAGDGAAGVELFRQAVADAPAAMSDRLFAGVVSQLPANLYLLNHADEALDLARRVEARVADNPERLLAVVAFYLSIEQPDEAARVAEAALRLKPDLAAAHQALGSAHRLALRLDKAAEEFARALELDPRSAPARRSLADLRRATGKAEDALALYREQLAADPKDVNARAGMVLSLFDAGRREEAERELESALAEQPDNLPLLVGAAYWHVARGDGARGLELAERAVSLEPRFKWAWARIAFARALLAQKRPLQSEQALRLARQLGSFPTVNYELAGALSAAGLYQEAAEELAKVFSLKDGQVETLLAGRVAARAPDFIELLAPERRASLFQFSAADTEANARMLKALLAFHTALGGERGGADDEAAARAAASEFVAGDDGMRAFRQLYVAGRLLQRGAALDRVLEATEAAMGGVEAALGEPAVTVALLADELRELRARAEAAEAAVTVPDVPRNVLSNLLRGRIEHLAGWALYRQGKAEEAAARLRLAVSVLPEYSPWWRAAQWHLGAALDSAGSQREALAAYVKSYRLAPDPARRAVIEVLYKKINGSTGGLDTLLKQPPAGDSASAQARPAETRAPQPGAATAVGEPTATGDSAPASAPTSPAPGVASPPATDPTPAPTETPVSPPAVIAEAETAKETPAPTPEPKAETGSAPEAVAPAAPETTSARKPGGRDGGSNDGGGCKLSLSEAEVTISGEGGSATVVASLEGAGGAGASQVKAATRNWADIIVLAELRTPNDGSASSRFTISSISRKAGTFVVSFDSPCGKQALTVNVK